MKQLRIKFTGGTPLLMHNGRLADPTYPWSREIKKISGKRKKTDSDFEEMARLEWYGGLYLNEDGALFITPEMVEAALQTSAKREKKGRDFARALVCRSTSPLDIGATKTLDELWPDLNYRLTTGVVIKRSRVMRTRARFDKWEFIATIEFDEFVIEQRDLENIARAVCLGDWRPKFGQATGQVVS